ncbi:DUF2177 family protein [Parasphingorhabdus halotolerans]|uniref:DUF2177 family protein n=1 Tax=Parasphingorhabdus halotolerans TaxID=2725558 RepID=A0A6H2DLU6_9SPHN|nr:DUF2177 family protein [Parasphingorhabdus halotolerans]QJB69324.1 DUF2177 family protein [Parasphingorhabdus halotolerans]
MAQYLIAYIIAAVIFGILDAIWLSNAAEKLYRPIIGDLMADQFRLAPALVFYALYLAGIMWFALRPALQDGQWTTALLNGALLGFFCYATYDLTNQAVMKVWTTKLSVIDIIWGTFATGTTAALTAFLVLRFVR